MCAYKYEVDLNTLENCPFEDCVLDTLDAYRFVFEGMNGDSFIPVLKISPERISQPPFKDDNHFQCSGYGLSMFTTESQARAKFNKLRKRNNEIYKILGEKIASGTITPDLGERSEISRSTGHFDFFEYESCDLSQHFSIVGDLV